MQHRQDYTLIITKLAGIWRLFFLSASKDNPTHASAQIPTGAPRVWHALRMMHLYCVQIRSHLHHGIREIFRGRSRNTGLYQRRVWPMRLQNSCSLKDKTLYPSSTVGVEFDNAINMSSHVSAICKTVNFHLWNLSRVRMYIDETTCHHAIRARTSHFTSRLCQFTFPRLIYSKELKRLQRLQNKAAKLIFMAKKVWPCISSAPPTALASCSQTGLNSRLSFLFINVSLAMHHLISLNSSLHISLTAVDFVQARTPCRLLTRPKTRLCFANKGFYACAPKLWNNLPRHIRHAPSLTQFKSSLKTHLILIYWLLVFMYFLLLFSAVVPLLC